MVTPPPPRAQRGRRMPLMLGRLLMRRMYMLAACKGSSGALAYWLVQRPAAGGQSACLRLLSPSLKYVRFFRRLSHSSVPLSLFHFSLFSVSLSISVFLLFFFPGIRFIRIGLLFLFLFLHYRLGSFSLHIVSAHSPLHVAASCPAFWLFSRRVSLSYLPRAPPHCPPLYP